MDEMPDQMSLREFIKQSLVDINAAIIEAHEAGVQLVYNKYQSGYHPKAQEIKFDLAVQINNQQSKSTAKNAGLTISVLNLGFKGDKGEKSDLEKTNRIQFSVEAFLGLEKDEKKREE